MLIAAGYLVPAMPGARRYPTRLTSHLCRARSQELSVPALAYQAIRRSSEVSEPLPTTTPTGPEVEEGQARRVEDTVYRSSEDGGMCLVRPEAE